VKTTSLHRLLLALALAVSLLPTPAGAVVRTVNGHTNTNVNRNINQNYNSNVNVNRNVNVGVDRWGAGCCYHPVARATTAVAATAVTAAAIGSMVRTLPPSCTMRSAGGVTYQYCGGTWYQPSYVGSDVQYTVVAAPM
jgi:hypothetical protein